jgi:hypothetical protein
MTHLRIAVGVAALLIALTTASAGQVRADDHLFCAVNAGGLTSMSNPFTKTNGRSGASVPGQGSPLCGADNTTPAVAADQISPNANPGNGVTRTPPPVGTVTPPNSTNH